MTAPGTFFTRLRHIKLGQAGDHADPGDPRDWSHLREARLVSGSPPDVGTGYQSGSPRPDDEGAVVHRPATSWREPGRAHRHARERAGVQSASSRAAATRRCACQIP